MNGTLGKTKALGSDRHFRPQRAKALASYLQFSSIAGSPAT